MDKDTAEFYERVEMTHAEQEDKFGWCMCEGEGHKSEGCPQ